MYLSSGMLFNVNLVKSSLNQCKFIQNFVELKKL
jgi:hypothetical protein